jgi:hypothetical protein
MADSRAIESLARLRASLPDACRELYRVRDKGGKIVPFDFNDSQVILHRHLEDQLARCGWVRAIVLKGRQQGCSTYVAARFYHKTSMKRGVNTYILSHEQSASDTLFGIVDRFQRNNPLKPHVGISNVKELEFDKLDSSYAVATAGNKAGGRSKAISLMHGSEVSYWTNAQDHFSASVQGVPLMPGTEIILESTSAGASGEFYERYMEAESGRGDYQAIFLPWWLDEGYQRDPEAGFQLSSEAVEGFVSEREYAELYGLSDRRMAWRRAKIHELRDMLRFQREYPAEPHEAWTSPSGAEVFISAISVSRARKRTGEGAGPLILGVDPASNGGDRFAVAARRGMCVEWVRYRNRISHAEGAAWIASLVEEFRPARVNVDAGNIGAAVITQLKSMSPAMASLVRGVNFGSTSQAKLARPKVPGPGNRRAEMWGRLRDWLLDETGAILPDDAQIQTDITAPRLKPMPNNDFLLESKKDMKLRNVRSPDLADAIALTFASLEFFRTFDAPAPVASFGNVDRPAPVGYTSMRPAASPYAWMG